MNLALDKAAPIPAQAAKDLGVSTILRYLPTAHQAFGCTRAELDGYLAVGLSVGLIFEENGNAFLGGAPAGRDTCIRAMRARDSLGLTAADLDLHTCLIDPNPGALYGHEQQLADFAGTWGDTIDGRGFRGYGSADAARIARAAAGARYLGTWGVGTWGFGERGDGSLPDPLPEPADLIQHANRGYFDVAGVQCDQNTILSADHGQWPRPAPPHPPQSGDEMTDMCWNPKRKKMVAMTVGTDQRAYYCEQDNETGDWSPWKVTNPADAALLTFVRQV